LLKGSPKTTIDKSEKEASKGKKKKKNISGPTNKKKGTR